MATEDEAYQAEIDKADAEILSEMTSDGVLLIRRAAAMSEQRRFDMARWLRQHADDLVDKGKDYAELFTGRFNPDPGTEV